MVIFFSKRKIFGLITFAVLLCLASSTFGRATSNSTVFWDSLSITANGNDITSSLAWTDQTDSVDYDELVDEWPSSTNIPSLEVLNPVWGGTFSVNESSLPANVSASDLTVDPNTISLTNSTAYNGRSETSFFRQGFFTAPEDGDYTFSVDYSLSAEANNSFTENGGSFFAVPFVELQYIRNDGLSGDFTFQSPEDEGIFVEAVNSFGTSSFEGALSIEETFSGNSIAFNAGDTIELDLTLLNQVQSFSTEIIPSIPEPETYAMLLIGLGLAGFMANRRKTLHSY